MHVVFGAIGHCWVAYGILRDCFFSVQFLSCNSCVLDHDVGNGLVQQTSSYEDASAELQLIGVEELKVFRFVGNHAGFEG